jgi:hypothetical protein
VPRHKNVVESSWTRNEFAGSGLGAMIGLDTVIPGREANPE